MSMTSASSLALSGLNCSAVSKHRAEPGRSHPSAQGVTTIASVEVNPFRCTLTELRQKRQAKAGGIELSMEQIIALADIDRALWWVLSQPMHTAPSAGEVTLLPKGYDAAERSKAAKR